jgi:glycosyltransferase involved in cell wall biosynthesis
LLLTSVFPPDPGGIAGFAQDLATLFQNAGCELRVTGANEGSHGCNSRLAAYAHMIKRAKRVAQQVSSGKPDLVIVTQLLPLGPGAILGCSRRTKLVFQIHGTEIGGTARVGWHKALRRFIYNRADQIWTNSRYTADFAAEYGCARKNIRTVQPFLNANALDLEQSLTHRQRSEVPIILTAAHLYPRKGIDLVLRALAQLTEVPWLYRIAGSPPRPEYAGFYENLAVELGIRDRVTFLGQLPRNKLWGEMAKADLFVMASRALSHDIESFGIVYIEAQLFGLPCIGTRFGGIPEAIGEAGLLVEAENVDQLKLAIRSLITDHSERARLSRVAVRRVKSGYSERARRAEIEEHLGLLLG